MLDQSEIIARLKQGDRNVYAEVVERWQYMIYNTALGIVQNDEDAEDITQEVFVTLYQKIDDFREESKLSTWLYSITIRKSRDHEKRKKSDKRGGFLKRVFSVKDRDEPVNFEHPGILLDQKEKATVLFEALKKLPERQRIAFTLHKLEGLSYQEIAAVMNLSLNAIESLQLRAKNKLKQVLNDYYQHHFKH